VTSPLPDILFDSECERLLKVASVDPRSYLLVALLLETGIKKAELLELQTDNFDFSNKYEPVVLLKHTGKQVFKDRKLKLPGHMAQVFDDYTQQYGVSGTLFPYTPRFIEQLLGEARSGAKISKKVTAGILRDTFVVRSVKRGVRLEEAFEKIGLAKSSYDDARKKYGRLTSKAL
jgi:integrase